eukprot:SAG31_NODE_9975_length_1202_cov_1.140526_2_plen_104_part_01
MFTTVLTIAGFHLYRRQLSNVCNLAFLQSVALHRMLVVGQARRVALGHDMDAAIAHCRPIWRRRRQATMFCQSRHVKRARCERLPIASQKFMELGSDAAPMLPK